MKKAHLIIITTAITILTTLVGCMTNSAGNLSSVPTRVYRGVYARDLGEFSECTAQTLMLLSDSSQTLLDEVRKANLDNAGNVYVELNAIALTPDSAHIATPYDSVLVVYKVNMVKPIDPSNVCIAPIDKRCVTLKEFGLDNLSFMQVGVLEPEGAAEKNFPGFSLTKNGSEFGELYYELRRGGGLVIFNVDTLQAIQEVVFSHPSSIDQFGVQIGTDSERLKTIRSALKAVPTEDGTIVFGCPGSHIFYLPSDTAGNTDSSDRAAVIPTKFTVNSIIWRRAACK